jgi:hypothetical protein
MLDEYCEKSMTTMILMSQGITIQKIQDQQKMLTEELKE